MSFYQVASQQTEFSGATTNHWVVSLDKSGSSPFAAKASDLYIITSQLTHVASESIRDWESVSVSPTAKSATETLNFLAWGADCHATNMPLIAFLAGDQAAPGQIPEPASLASLGGGLAGVSGIVRRGWRRAGRPELSGSADNEG